MNNNSEDIQTNNMSPVAAGVTGFILGVVGTAALALSDKDTRVKVTTKANAMRDTLKKWSDDTLHDLQVTGDEVAKRAEERMETTKSQTNSAGDVKQKVEDSLNEAQKKEL